jgi:hypothetical protein
MLASTTRRSVDSDASSGTTIIHATRNEVIPPVSAAANVTRPVRLAADIRCAAPSRPERERKIAIAIGDRNQTKARADSIVGRPTIARYKGKTPSAKKPPSKCEAIKDWCRAKLIGSLRADSCTSE